MDDNERRYKGHIDVPLSLDGIEQISRLAARIKGMVTDERAVLYGVNKVYSSDLIRAGKSAGIIGEVVGVEPVIVPELRERNFGLWEGMTFDEISRLYPGDFGKWADNPLRFSPMGGESTMDVYDRVVPAFRSIVERHWNQRIVIVAHGGVNRIILCDLLAIPLGNIFKVEQDFGALNIVTFHDETPSIKLMNCTA